MDAVARYRAGHLLHSSEGVSSTAFTRAEVILGSSGAEEPRPNWVSVDIDSPLLESLEQRATTTAHTTFSAQTNWETDMDVELPQWSATPGRTISRLHQLIATASEWAEQMDVDPPDGQAVDRAELIIAYSDDKAADEYLRVFPGESGGITIQTMLPDLRIVEVEADRLTASWVHAERATVTHYEMASERAAAAFLLG